MKTGCFFLLLLFITGSCENTDYDDLPLGKWQLTSVLDKTRDTFYYYPGTLNTTIYINITDSSFVWLSGYCNSGQAEYTFENNNLRFYNASLTEMGCISIGGIWERYLYDLVDVIDHRVDDNHLSLITISDYNLYFSKIEE